MNAPWNFGSPDYTLTKELAAADFEATVSQVRDALATEGFGVLTEIDMQATLKKKLDRDVAPYLILGACNPALAYQAVTAEPGIGTLLPCNVVVARSPGGVTVSAISPRAMFSVVGRDDVQPIADDVAARLQRVLDALT